MTTVNTETLKSLGLTGQGTGPAQNPAALDQSEFLMLLTTQLSSQDPFKPMDNTDFITEMASFATVSGLEVLNQSFGNLATSVNQGQAMQAAALVGKEVLVPGDSAELDAGQGMTGAVGLANAADRVTVSVYDATGQVVQTLDLGPQSSGMQDFAWDGTLADGTPAPAGTYTFRATAWYNGGGTESVETFLGGQVQSVTADYANGGLLLDVQGLGTVGFGEVARIG